MVHSDITSLGGTKITTAMADLTHSKRGSQVPLSWLYVSYTHEAYVAQDYVPTSYEAPVCDTAAKGPGEGGAVMFN